MNHPRRSPSDGLRVLWLVFGAYGSTLLLLLLVLLFVVDSTEPSSTPGWYPYVLGAMSLVALLGLLYAKSRPLDVATSGALGASFRANWFLGLALAEAPAVWGFVGVFLVARLWPYLVGLVVSGACLGLMAPTSREIERRQREVTARGSPLSLREALSGQPPRG